MEWYLGDTTQSLQYLGAGYVDVAFTYNQAAEEASQKSGAAVERELVFLVSLGIFSESMTSAKLTIQVGSFPSRGPSIEPGPTVCNERQHRGHVQQDRLIGKR